MFSARESSDDHRGAQCTTRLINSSSIIFFMLVFAVISSYLFVASDRLMAIGFQSFGPFSTAYALSGDGNVVVGRTGELWRWTKETGIVDLPRLDLPGVLLGHRGTAASFDGSVIVGWSQTNEVGRVGFRWTQSDGIMELPLVPNDVSADGRVVVGNALNAARWTEQLGLELLGFPSDSPDVTEAEAVSADGQFIVGDSIVLPNGTPVRWVGESLEVEVLFRPGIGEFANISVTDISADGKVIVGNRSGLFISRQAFRWTEKDGRMDDPNPMGAEALGVTAVSGDGAVMVGGGSSVFEPGPGEGVGLIWDEHQGWRGFQQILVDSAVDIAGWSSLSPVDVSANGIVIVGNGINPEGQGEAWLVDLSNPAILPGDYNANNVVDQGDLDLVLLHWGSESTLFDPPDGWIRNLPIGRVDQAELDAVLLNWGKMQAEVGSVAAVPEPRSLFLLIALAPFALWCKPSTRRKSPLLRA
jgi:uncharacterized membrane protein